MTPLRVGFGPGVGPLFYGEKQNRACGVEGIKGGLTTDCLTRKNVLCYLGFREALVIPRTVLSILVYALPLLAVTFAVLMGGFALALATQDATGAVVLRWIAMSILILLVSDMVLLLGVLGLRALGEEDTQQDDSTE
jgi:hypothetical protein